MAEGRFSLYPFHVKILQPDDLGLAEAAAILCAGRLVAFPTETVYGLGADARNAEAVAAIFRAKDRPADNPLIVHVASAATVEELADVDHHPEARRLMERFWPGPLALVLPKRDTIPSIVSAGLSTVAVRMPAHPVALALIRASGVPIAAPSANRSGRPSPTTAQHVVEDLDDRIDAVLDGGACTIGVESTVLDLSDDRPVLLRPGGISAEELEGFLGDPVLLPGELDDGTPRSPGMKHRHYTPRCAVISFAPGFPPPLQPGDGVIVLSTSAPTGHFAHRVPSLDAYARELYAFFRAADEAGVTRLYVELPEATGLGRAIRDRILRAAGR